MRVTPTLQATARSVLICRVLIAGATVIDCAEWAAGGAARWMLRRDRSIERVYLHRAPVDMRRQIDGLSILAKEMMQLCSIDVASRSGPWFCRS